MVLNINESKIKWFVVKMNIIKNVLHKIQFTHAPIYNINKYKADSSDRVESTL